MLERMRFWRRGSPAGAGAGEEEEEEEEAAIRRQASGRGRRGRRGVGEEPNRRGAPRGPRLPPENLGRGCGWRARDAGERNSGCGAGSPVGRIRR